MLAGKVDTTTAVAAVGLASSGTLFGLYGPILGAAIVGGLIAVSEAQDKTWKSASWLLFRSVAMAVLFTTIACSWLATVTSFPVGDLIWPVAGFIAWMADKAPRLKDGVADFASKWLGRDKG